MSSNVAQKEQRKRNTFRAEEHLNEEELEQLDELTREYHVQRKAIIAKARERWIEENKKKLRVEKLKKEIEKSKSRAKLLEAQYKIITNMGE